MQKCEIEIGTNQKELNVHGTNNFPLSIYNDDLQLDLVPWHWHEEIELIVVTNNKLDIRIGSEKYVIEEGNGVFVNSEVLHYVSEFKRQPGQLKSIVFHPRIIGGYSDSIFWQKYLSPILKNPSLSHIILNKKVIWQKQIIDTILSTHTKCDKEEIGYEFEVRESLSSILYLIYKNCNAEVHPPSQKAIRDSRRSKNMLNYISKNYSSYITVKEIANATDISESEALRCFKKTTGTTPMQYVINYRLQRASELLVSTSMKIIDIAFESGFEETSYFTKKFKNKYKITPTQFRENFKDNTKEI